MARDDIYLPTLEALQRLEDNACAPPWFATSDTIVAASGIRVLDARLAHPDDLKFIAAMRNATRALLAPPIDLPRCHLPECQECGFRDCMNRDVLHYSVEGCPSCARMRLKYGRNSG